MNDYTGLALLLDNAAIPARRARLHAEGCNMLNAGKRGRRGMKIIREDLQTIVAELEDMGYPVVRCKCCPEVGK